jgi:ribonuclease P protein component
MLPSAARLKRRSDFGRVYGRRRSSATDLIVMYVMPGTGVSTRVGFSVSGKLGGAVIRNRTKRRISEAVRLVLPRITGIWDIVIVAKRNSVEAGFTDIQAAIETLLRRSGVIKAAGE